MDKKVAFVTGASGGLGIPLVTMLLEKGYIVGAQVFRHGDELAGVQEKYGNAIRTMAADLRREKDREKWFQTMIEAIGHPDVLIHNAGINANALSWKLPVKKWSEVLEVNLTAGFDMAAKSIPHMRLRQFGRIIFISSVVGFQGVAGTTAYAASKAGLTGLARALAAEVGGKGITVNCVAPGYLNAGMLHQVPENMLLDLLPRIPNKRFGFPEEFCKTVEWLISDDAAYIQGQTIHLNGGLY